MNIGEVLPASGDIELNKGRKTIQLAVVNTGDRPVQIGSHYHFYEVNAALKFDRQKAFGYHLNVPAGMAVRFEPQDEKTVELVAISGKREVYGMNGKTNGKLDK